MQDIPTDSGARHHGTMDGKQCEALTLNPPGEPCPNEAVEEVEGHALCWAHARAVKDGTRALEEVLKGE